MAQQIKIRASIEMRIKNVLDHGKYIMGPEVEELEDKLCVFTGAKHCITCSSGTDALLMALMAWDVKPNDAIFVPSFTFFATAEMPALLGATPIFVDIDPSTFTMRPDMLKNAILAVQHQDQTIYPIPKIACERQLTPRIILPVDIFGQAADYESILAIADEHELYVLEDAAQSLGGSRNGKKNCALGCHAAATSFFPAKPLGCYGDGGAVFTDNDALADSLRSIRVHGKGKDKYNNMRLGINGRLDTIQAAILLAKMEIFPQELVARQNIANLYSQSLADIHKIITPKISSECTSAWAQYCIMLPGCCRDSVKEGLKRKGIPTNVYYPKPQNDLAVFAGLEYTLDAMPAALNTSQNILALPFHPYLHEVHILEIVETLRMVTAI
jgi:dTDP-4-amino-4,6-dideoxygalactose transaminase